MPSFDEATATSHHDWVAGMVARKEFQVHADSVEKKLTACFLEYSGDLSSNVNQPMKLKLVEGKDALYLPVKALGIEMNPFIVLLLNKRYQSLGWKRVKLTQQADGHGYSPALTFYFNL